MKSPIAYIGGKSLLAQRIVDMMPEHDTYVEPFTGAGWVFFRKEPARCEVLNDLDGDLVSFYRCLQHHLEEFLKQFKFLLASRQLFREFNAELESAGLTDIQRAARYYYVQRLAFGGRPRGRTFGGASAARPNRINLLRLEEALSEAHLRLAGTMVENLPYQEVIERYDRPGTFFFFDPPYYKMPYYKHNFYKVSDYEEMAQRLGALKGRFLMTLNDCPETRRVFSSFIIEPVRLRYSVSKGKRLEGTELLISNYSAAPAAKMVGVSPNSISGTSGDVARA